MRKKEAGDGALRRHLSQKDVSKKGHVFFYTMNVKITDSFTFAGGVYRWKMNTYEI